MGAGSISLPAAIASIGDTKGAILPAIGILFVMGALSAFTFSVIGKETSRYKAANFEEVWSQTIGPKSIWVISASIAVTTFLACTAYAMIIGDLVSALASTFGFTGLLAARSTSILGLTGGVIMPLCFLKSLAALSVTSLLGVFAVIFSTTVMGVRFFDGSYALPSKAAPLGGKFLNLVQKGGGGGGGNLPFQPSFGALRGGWSLDHMSFVLLSCLGTAFLCHFNAPTFYNDLKDKSPERFDKVARVGFGVSTAVFAAMMAFGFGTFGSATAGNVFVNYNSADTLATLCRFATAFSITFTYPLAFVALKSAVVALMNTNKDKGSAEVEAQPLSERTNFVVTTGLLTVITSLALVLKDLGFVAALTGSLMGSLIIYVFPGLFRLKTLQNPRFGGHGPNGSMTLGDKAASYGLIGTGAVLGVVGVVVSFLKQFTSILG